MGEKMTLIPTSNIKTAKAVHTMYVYPIDEPRKGMK